MFEKLKNIYEKIINTIVNKNKVHQLDTLYYERVVKSMNEKRNITRISK